MARERSPQICEEEAQKDQLVDLRYKSIFNLNVEQENEQVDRSKTKQTPKRDDDERGLQQQNDDISIILTTPIGAY